MRIDVREFRMGHKGRVRLSEWPTRVKPPFKSKHEYRRLLDEHIGKLRARQALLNADRRHALLLIFQATDAGGKDGAIKHVMSGVNPQGCEVFSFKEPSTEELAHDFLWRTNLRLPERGRIGIFNRSYYEEVLIARVHPEILEAQRLPEGTINGRHFWRHRFHSINELEKHLDRNGTRILKFFLHLSKGEQRRRFLERIDDPDKNWKLSAADFRERAHWREYIAAYEACLGATSTRHAPWHIVPADDKETARLIISQVVLDALDGLKLAYPKPGRAQQRELQAVRKALKS